METTTEPLKLTTEANSLITFLNEDKITNPVEQWKTQLKDNVSSEVMKNAGDYKNTKEMQAAITGIYKTRLAETKKLFHSIGSSL
jgi:hypothetical protein